METNKSGNLVENQTAVNSESVLPNDSENLIDPSGTSNNPTSVVWTTELFNSLTDNSSKDALMGQYHVGLVDSTKVKLIFTGEDLYHSFA